MKDDENLNTQISLKKIVKLKRFGSYCWKNVAKLSLNFEEK